MKKSEKTVDKAKAYKYYRRIVSVVFPNCCPFCGKIIGADEYWCESCIGTLPYVNNRLLPPENIDRFYACCYYTQKVRTAVHSMKFDGKIYAVDALSELLLTMLSDELKKADMLVPVPSGLKSVVGRGFAPAEMIAQRISWSCKIPAVKALRARKDKTDQKELSREQRIENAKNSFYIDSSAVTDIISGKRIILIDDVCATGSTLSASAGLLKNAGAARITAAVFAKTCGLAQRKMPRGKYFVRR